MKSCINVSQKNNLVIIKINEEAEFSDIEKSIKAKVVQLKKLYKEEKTPIKIVGKVMKNKEIKIIEDIIKEKLGVEVDFDMPRELGLSNIKKAFAQEILTSETKFHRGSLRSGQRIEEEGSVIILGDVNSGAEVIAADNIVVLGTLRGLAHAGAKGNKEAIVSAGRLDTVQIRIANIVKEIDRDEELLCKLAYVYVEGEEINIISL
ncbi:MAG: septum site-determining protein MinC [Clostridia bacterium]|nr:septum site-determining protein MinC [Clostridia bacterium]